VGEDKEAGYYSTLYRIAFSGSIRCTTFAVDIGGITELLQFTSLHECMLKCQKGPPKLNIRAFMRYFMDFSLKTHHNVSRNFRACFFVSLLLSLPTLFPASLEILATTCCLSFLFSPPRHRLKHHFFLSNYRCHDL
jgi:hypothetical protein